MLILNPLKKLQKTSCEKSSKRVTEKSQLCGTVAIFYGSGSDFWTVMVPVPTFKKLWFRFLLLKTYSSGSGSSSISRPLKADFSKKMYCKIWMKKKILNEGNQIHNFISNSGFNKLQFRFRFHNTGKMKFVTFITVCKSFEPITCLGWFFALFSTDSNSASNFVFFMIPISTMKTNCLY